eukprot:5765305-Prorocentrum_lima.AAC.1
MGAGLRVSLGMVCGQALQDIRFGGKVRSEKWQGNKGQMLAVDARSWQLHASGRRDGWETRTEDLARR